MDQDDVAERFALAIAQVAAARRARGTIEFRCSNPSCGRVLGEYIAPVRLFIVRCRRCGLYSELTATD